MALAPSRVQGMFGNVAACRHTLGDRHREWVAAMCGTCLAVRDGSGQLSRALVTTDAIAAAVLARDVGAVELDVRRAGPCPARGMRPATVWTGRAAAIGAAVSLLAAGTAVEDRVVDGDLPAGRLLRRPVRAWAGRVLADGAALAVEAGVDPAPVLAARRRSHDVERVGPADLAAWCAPVEDAYGAVFAVCGLAEVGAAIGRVTLLADAVADRDDDRAAGAPNPILAGACSTDDAVAAVRRDLSGVARRVAEAAPGSLAALLWGPAWTRGVERRMAPVCGGAHACRHPAAAGPAERTAGLVRLSGAIAGVGVAVALAEQEQKKDRWCDSCECGCDCCGECCDCDCCCCCDC